MENENNKMKDWKYSFYFSKILLDTLSYHNS